MGGCRCTYRNCMVKTDGKTHMFHYPVFDKVRCHQWLINAHRLEYLNLKVSQLKNRVVCQHHFKDQCFMNFKKEKLTFEAIPTEDGPYCDPSKWVDKSQEFTKLYPIVIEDIENDYVPIDDKKASFSLKYIDFLTNSESIDNSYRKQDTNNISQSKCDNVAPFNFVLNNNIAEKANVIEIEIDDKGLLNNKSMTIKDEMPQIHPEPIIIIPPYFEKSNINVNNVPPINEYADGKMSFDNKNPTIQQTTNKSKPKVRIISEKKITNPVPISGNFKPILPSVILNVSNVKQNYCTRSSVVSDEKSREENKHVIHQDLESKVLLDAEVTQTVNTPNITNMQYIQALNDKSNTNLNDNKESKISILKNKLSPERVAAIKEKRKFNMKLKDIIESCVIKVEEPERSIELALDQTKHDEFVKEPEIRPSNSENYKNNEKFLTNLEARMTRMENLLLNKIDQNTQRFMDLKQSIVSPKQKKSVSTQTAVSEEAYKRFLYAEISKYLGAESNNLIYQELFIDKYAKNSCTTSSVQKRRKYR